MVDVILPVGCKRGGNLMNFRALPITYCIAITFSLTSSGIARADQLINVSPIIVQPEDLRGINQQMIAQDRINRDQELAIRGLIEDNQKLTDTALAHQQDATLEKINQTMKDYLDALLSRDKARIADNSQAVSPRYRDLVYLTEDIDNMKDAGRTLEQKNYVIGEKYNALTELKDELQALNVKLKLDAASDNFSKTPPQQEDKIQYLTRRLGEMDQKIAHFDEILAQKDRQISQLKDKVSWLNQVLAVTKIKAEYYRLSSLQKAPPKTDDLVRLARQLISLQEEELSLLQEKSRLWGAQSALGDQHVQEIENKIKGLMDNHQLQKVDLQSRMEELKKELGQKELQVELLKSELENKIVAERNQGDSTQRDNEITSLKAKILSAQLAGAQTESLKLRLAEQEDKAALLKQELEGKVSDTNKMTLMMSDYQKRLEDKDNAYNQQLGQIAFLNSQLNLKEAQIVKIKKDLNELQEASSARDKEDQSKELNLSMVEQKQSDAKDIEYQDKIRSLKTELALERQQLDGMPSSDEIGYLREGMKKAAVQIKQKDEMISSLKKNGDKYENEYRLQSLDYQNLKSQLQSTYNEIHRDNEVIKDRDLEITRLKERYAIATGKTYENSVENALKAQLLQAKANAEEYERKYKEQSREFESLKGQLQDAYDEINRKNEDLKYKNLEILRIKERSPASNTHENKGENLQEQLDIANGQIKNLQNKLNQLSAISKDDVIRQKLRHALDEIDEQGRVINVLVQKLQDAGQSVNLSEYLSKKN